MVTDTKNHFFDLADQYVRHTNRHVFITGKAGTGKTTFLRHIKNTTNKNTVIVAPTGVAAINAGGVTIHSFFQLPFGTFIPDTSTDILHNNHQQVHNKLTLFGHTKVGKNKRKLMNDLELLIIDEASMVRADILDAIDTVLRHFRGRPDTPFGGVQVALIGDLFQLPPVVPNDEWTLLSRYYESQFFFSAHALKDAQPVCIELQKVYRQSDPTFVSLLNEVRTNQMSPESMKRLNSLYTDENIDHNDTITLTSHNYQARSINDQELSRLPGKVHRFKAEAEGNFSTNAFPASEVLILKEGAQVMFVKNDSGEEKRYFNGKIGTIKSIKDNKITVTFKGEDDSLTLEREEWQNIRYKYNEGDKKVEEEVIGTFRQYPVRLAWAITIHKSQGLTFDKAIIDAGKSFSAGQVYVALSRLRTMEGIILRSRITPTSIHCDPLVLDFFKGLPDADELSGQLSKDQKAYIAQSISRCFEWNSLMDEFQDHLELYRDKKVSYQQDAVAAVREWLKALRAQHQTAQKFQHQLHELLAQGPDAYDQLASRIKAACTYFLEQLDTALSESIKQHIEEVPAAKKIKTYGRNLVILQKQVNHKKASLEQALKMAESLAAGEESSQALEKIKSVKVEEVTIPPAAKKGKKQEKGASQRMSLDMYKGGKTIDDIAKERGLAASTISQHLTFFIRTGEVDVTDFVTEEQLNNLLPIIEKEETLSGVKQEFGDDVSYEQIHAARNYLIYRRSLQEKK